MELYEYLMKELHLEEELSKKIADKTKEYHHAYGKHHRDPGPVDPYQAVRERPGTFDKNDLSKYHCSGCEKGCALSDPACGRGKKTALAIKDL